MDNILMIVQIIVAVLVIILILVQARGTGFSRSMGGGNQASFSRRGLEKLIFKLTFVVVGIFVIISILRLFI